MRAPLRIACIGIAVGSLAAAGRAQQTPDTYGTAVESYVRVPAVAFQPYRGVDGPVYTTGDGISGLVARYGSGNSFFTAPLNLPAGALITSIEFDYCDQNAASNRSFLKLVVTSWSGNVVATTPFLEFVYNPSCGYQALDVTSSNIIVDNYYNAFNLFFYHNIGDGSESITGAMVGYKLQVSAPPGSPTFNDVPTNHPFFQYIEALSKSGITGGCGSGNYCPDNPVTRGQMAVFLAKALGLAFP